MTTNSNVAALPRAKTPTRRSSSARHYLRPVPDLPKDGDSEPGEFIPVSQSRSIPSSRFGQSGRAGGAKGSGEIDASANHPEFPDSSADPDSDRDGDGDGTLGGMVHGGGLRSFRKVPRRSRRGLISILLSVAVVAVVIVGIVALYTRISTSVRTTAVETTINAAQAELRRAYANAPNYEATMTPLLVSALPEDAIRGTGAARQVVTPWGGRVTAGGGDTPSATGTGAISNDRFFVSVLGLPESACESLASAFMGRPDVVGLSIRGNDTNFTQVRTAAQIAAFDTVTEALNACNGGDNDNLAIVFRG